MSNEDLEIAKRLEAGGEVIEDLVYRQEMLEKNAKANQPVIDSMVAGEGRRRVNAKGKTLGTAIVEQLEERKGEVRDFLQSRHNKLTLEIKTSGVLLTSDHLTGDPMASYGGAAILPSPLLNLRDLLRTVPSPNGTLITYREGTVTNSVAVQTEGQAKIAQDYVWSEIKSTSSYLAARTKFSKQLMFNLDFLQNALVVELMRDFHRKENDSFFITLAQAATGSTSLGLPATTTDSEELIRLIANQIQAGYSPDFAFVNPAEWARILATKPSDYSLPFGFNVDVNGNIRVAGTRLIVAPWVQSDHVLIMDASQVERCETESLRVEFATQNEDDWIKNLLCARIECFEALNIRRPDSLIYADFGNS